MYAISSVELLWALFGFFFLLGLIPRQFAPILGFPLLTWGLLALTFSVRFPRWALVLVYGFFLVKFYLLVTADRLTGFCWAELVNPDFRFMFKLVFGTWMDLNLIRYLPGFMLGDIDRFCVFRLSSGLFHVDYCSIEHDFKYGESWPVQFVLDRLAEDPAGTLFVGALVMPLVLAMLVLLVALPLATLDLWDRQVISAMVARHKASGAPFFVAWFFTLFGWLWYLIVDSKATYVIAPLIFVLSFPLFVILFVLSVLQFLFDYVRNNVLVRFAPGGKFVAAKRAAMNKARALRRVSIFDLGGRKARKELAKLAKEQEELALDAGLQAAEEVGVADIEISDAREEVVATRSRANKLFSHTRARAAVARARRDPSPDATVRGLDVELLDQLPGPPPSGDLSPVSEAPPPSYVSRVRTWVASTLPTIERDEVFTPRLRPLLLPAVLEGKQSPVTKPENLAGSSG